MTLIEMIVSIAILLVVSGAIAGIFAIGIRVVSPNGPQQRMFGAHDLSVLEQSLGRDAARAACIQALGTQYGSCDKVPVADCPASPTVLCFAWPVVSAGSCHVAVYNVGSNTMAQRAEFAVGTPSPLSTVQLARENRVNIAVVAPVHSAPPGESYQWVRALTVTISATVVLNAPAQTLTLHPVATDPSGANAAISGGIPC